jgi:hypothetical protein
MNVTQTTRKLFGIEPRCVSKKELNKWHYKQVKQACVIFAATTLTLGLTGVNPPPKLFGLLLVLTLYSYLLARGEAAVRFDIEDCSCSNPIAHDYLTKNRGT